MTSTVAIALLSVALVGGILLLLPRMARPTVPFGVRVPDSQVDAPVIRSATSRYYRGVLLTALAVAGATAALNVVAPAEVVLVLASFALLAAWFVPFLAARRTVMAAKRTEGWFDDVRQTAVADTSMRTSPPRYPWAWTVPSVVIALATVATGIAVYPTLPDRIATHIGPAGPDRYADTTLWTVFGLVAIQLLLTAMMLGLVSVVLRGKADLAAAAPAASAEQYRRYAMIMARCVLVLAAAVNLTLLVTALMIWEVVPADAVWMIAAFAPSAVATVALIVLSIRTGQSGHRLSAQTGLDRPSAATADRDDDTHWIGGLIYVNRADPALWVPKRFGGVGWTMNLGRPAAWALTVVVLGGTLGVLVWALVQGTGADDESAGQQADVATADLAAIEGTPVGDRLDWVLGALAAAEPPSEPALDDAFDGLMLSQVTSSQLQSVFTQYAGDYDVTALITATPITATVDIDDGAGQRWRHVLTVSGYEPDARISGIYFLPVSESHSYADWDEVGAALDAQAGEVTYLAAEVDGTTCRPLAAQDSAEQRPIGSAIKLYVLGALADAVAAGTVAWDDEITVENHLRSIPAGLLQDAERGSVVTVAQAAELMMALSDNTATDHLIAMLGRDTVEQALENYGHAEPELNRPLLTTRELAQLKWQVDAGVRDAYIEADTAGRHDILAELADEPLDVAMTDLATPVTPDGVAWFASAADLCTVLARLDDVAVEPGMEPVGQSLGASSIVRVDHDTWTRTAAKGGSEPGVLAFGWLLARHDGRTFAFATTLLDDGAIAQGAVTPVLEGTLDLLAAETG